MMLQRLAALRRLREQRAREALTAQTHLLRRAEHRAEGAARAVSEHVRETVERERALTGAVAGRAVQASAIVRIQLELDGAALETAQRRAVEAQALSDLARQQRIRAEALANFQLRQRAMARLDHVRKEETARQIRWHAALSDVEAEDFAAAAGRQS
jgi:hypothetical protein